MKYIHLYNAYIYYFLEHHEILYRNLYKRDWFEKNALNHHLDNSILVHNHQNLFVGLLSHNYFHFFQR